MDWQMSGRGGLYGMDGTELHGDGREVEPVTAESLDASLDSLGETALKLKRRHEKLLEALKKIVELDRNKDWQARNIAEHAIENDDE